jgi:archaellum biogenesis protein FlaJ (TadC family)
MSVDVRPAMPAVFPRAVAFRARRDRMRRWFATIITVLTAAIAILVVAAAAVVMGIT